MLIYVLWWWPSWGPVGTKLSRNVPWMVLYKVSVFRSSRIFNMVARAEKYINSTYSLSQSILRLDFINSNTYFMLHLSNIFKIWKSRIFTKKLEPFLSYQHHIQHGFAPYQITFIWLYWYAEYRCWWSLAWSSELVISFLVHLDQRSMGTIAKTKIW
jgi:hypothetical protein